MTKVIECVNLTSGYSGVPVIRNLNLEVNEGELIAILGPNGSGKTTTLLTIAGVLNAIKGNVNFRGQPVSGGRPDRAARKGLMLVPDDRSIFFELTTRENIRMGRNENHGDAVKMVLEYFPALESRMNMRAGLLSGGEQQMLAIGRAITKRPKVLMIDEMSLGLAPIVVKRILPVIRRVASEIGTAVILVEQHIDLALQVVDRAYVFNHGEVVQQGLASDLLKQRELLEASYLGAEELPAS
jgi:branched-chain amino acid transport system ATP-binding protein